MFAPFIIVKSYTKKRLGFSLISFFLTLSKGGNVSELVDSPILYNPPKLIANKGDIKMKNNLRALTKQELVERLPKLGSLADKELDQIIVPIKVVSPLLDWEWYLYEVSEEMGICFGFVRGFDDECGSVSIDNLIHLCGQIDDSYEPQTLKQLTGW